MDTREEIRRSALTRRDAISSTERERMSEAIATRLENLLADLGVRCVHCYVSFRSEVQTRALINRMLERGLKVIVPVIEELDGRPFLVHTQITHLNNLQQGHFGLEQPVERTAASLDDLDVVILPLAAFDRAGNRLGYGKGFYDRFLLELRPHVRRIGLAFSVQQFPSVYPQPHDQPLDIILTETEMINAHAVRKEWVE